LSATRINAEPMDPSAAICLTDVGDRVMEESSTGIIRWSKNKWRRLQPVGFGVEHWRSGSN
jgi:hypothetical protein